METFKVNYSAKNIMLLKERERVQDQTITENRMYHWKNVVEIVIQRSTLWKK